MKDFRITLIYLILISIFLLSMMSLIAYSATDNENEISAKSFLLYNPDTNTVITEKNADIKLPMASTTKIMTALLAIEKLDPKDKVTVPMEAVGIEGSSLYLSEGDKINAEDLIYSVLLQSANDAAAALAIQISGDIASFAELMTHRAHEIGAMNTKFQNPHGLDAEGHYTTARDLALISAEAMRNETFKRIVKTYKYTFLIGDKTRTVVNHNKMLKRYDGCIGIKTGYTKKSGRCLVTASKKNGVTLIAVTLSAPNDWNDHKRLLNLGSNLFTADNIFDIANIPTEIKVINSDKQEIDIGIPDKENILVHKKDEAIEVIDIDIPQYLAKTTKKGDVIGSVTVRIGDKEKKINIAALEDATVKNKRTLFGRNIK